MLKVLVVAAVLAFVPVVGISEEVLQKPDGTPYVEQEYGDWSKHKVKVNGIKFYVIPAMTVEWILLDVVITDESYWVIDSLKFECYHFNEQKRLLSSNEFTIQADFDEHGVQILDKHIIGPNPGGAVGSVCYIPEYTLKTR